tara:strand:- start:835 stop:1137 length:303 start_codon:yes stop_codon:yes gene_type:complete
VEVLVLGFSKWLNKVMNRNALHKTILAERSGLSVGSIESYLRAEYEPRMSNLIAIVAVISIIEDRSPTQIMFEAVVTLPEMIMIEERWHKKRKDPSAGQL